jgi:hypothetical protein
LIQQPVHAESRTVSHILGSRRQQNIPRRGSQRPARAFGQVQEGGVAPAGSEGQERHGGNTGHRSGEQ